MSNKAPALNKFKDFNGEFVSTIGNYSQDCKTGKLLATQFYQYLVVASRTPVLKDKSRLNKLIKNLPKGEDYQGLFIGFFSSLSAHIEPLITGAQSTSEPMSRNELMTSLEEIQAEQSNFELKIKCLAYSWFDSFIFSVNSPDYSGLERCMLSDLVTGMPTYLDFEKNCYTLFCSELTNLLFNFLKDTRAAL